MSHPHQPIESQEPDGPYQILGRALEQHLLEKGVVSAEEMRRTIEVMDSRSPAQGARVVARAWVDGEFRKRLRADAKAAVTELGIEPGATGLMIVENTPTLHNLVVCTLCSCYPRWLLGTPPDWYKSKNYRSRAVSEPRKVLEEFGTFLDEDVAVQVHDSTADLRYLVLPCRPEGTGDLSEKQLAELVSRDTMIGVALPKASAV